MPKDRIRPRGPVEQLRTGSAYFSAQGLEVGHFGPLWHILKVAQLLERELNRISGLHALSLADFHLLGALMMEDGVALRATDLALALNVTNAVLTGRVRRLAGAGLVVRRTDGADRRAVMLGITPEGAAKVNAIARSIEREARFLSFFRQLDEPERSMLGDLLGNMHAFLERDFVPSRRPDV